MRNQKMKFGKHKGETIQEILNSDPSYIIWMYENDVMELGDDIVEDAYCNDANASPPESFYWEP